MVNLRNDYCGVCHPKILEALTKKSSNFYTGYGMDNETAEAEIKIKKLINNDKAHVYFTVGGTSTNKIVIAHALPSYGCAIACDSGHINVHETGAIEATGHKVITVPNVNGKLTASGVEELLDMLFEMIDEAKNAAFTSDKCIIERDKALDLLDDLSAQLPSELKQARTIVASRDELIAQARGEAKNVIAAAQDEAAKLVEKEVIYQQTVQKCQEMARANMAECEERTRKTEETMAQIKAASFGYVDNSLRQTEETILKALGEVRDTRAKFQSITTKPAAPAAAPAPAATEAPKEEEAKKLLVTVVKKKFARKQTLTSASSANHLPR